MTSKRSGNRKVDTPGGRVSVAVDSPKGAHTLLFFANGAGGDMHSDFMSFVGDGLAAAGVAVCRFNFLYQEKGRKTPDRQPLLEDTYRAIVDAVSVDWSGPVALGGKSMGGRIASHLAATGEEAVDGLVFFGYPLHAPGRPDRVRDEHLHDVKVPMLFIEGTRDPFCPLETLDKVRADLPFESEVRVIDDGDHSFKVRKSSGRTLEDSWGEVIEAASQWMASLAGR